jgi:hypothetical protein
MSGTQVFVLAIIAIVMCAQVMRSRFKHKSKKPEDDPELENTLQKIEQLEERIRVLERIVTENRYDLRKEIDSL